MKVLFLDTVHPILEERLVQRGFECIHDYRRGYREVIDKHNACDGIVIRSRLKLDMDFLRAFPSLKFVARSGAGLENIDVEAAKALDIKVFNSPEGNRDAVAEHAAGMLLMLLNRLKQADTQVRNGLWRREENRGIELCGKTVGIIGYGHMGAAFAQRLPGFGVTVLAYDKYKSGFGGDYAVETSLDQLLDQADVLSLHVPLTPETHYYFDKPLTSRLQKPVYLINTSRGAVVNTGHLTKCLDNGVVRGACLDVLEHENHSFEQLDMEENSSLKYLIYSEKVLLSPHIAGWTKESYHKLSEYLADKILDEFGR